MGVKGYRRKYTDALRKQIILELAETGMNIAEVARRLSYFRGTIEYHIKQIRKETGKNPLYFYDLAEMVGLVRAEESLKVKIIEVNPDFREEVEANDGYCPCMVERSEDTKCMCKDFREQESGLCHCGRFEKVKGE